MPLPTPTEGETQDEFVSRCMGDETANADFPEQEQRAAVCYRQWSEAEKATTDASGPQTDSTTTNRDGSWSTSEGVPALNPMPPGFEYALDTSLTDWDETAEQGNALKALKRTDDEIVVGNYIVLFGGRDLEGIASSNTNPDGSAGEYFTPETALDSPYTKAGALYVDWEHQQGELGDEVLGIVNWKTARIDDRGVFVERVLSRRSRYVQWLDELGWFDDGTLGTSSQADPKHVEKAPDGQIVRWPLVRDTVTVQPMEPRMLSENQLRAFKALGLDAPDDTEATPEPEPEASPEADTSAVDVAKAKARLQRIKHSLLEVLQ